jgi:hypothetical protein
MSTNLYLLKVAEEQSHSQELSRAGAVTLVVGLVVLQIRVLWNLVHQIEVLGGLILQVAALQLGVVELVVPRYGVFSSGL